MEEPVAFKSTLLLVQGNFGGMVATRASARLRGKREDMKHSPQEVENMEPSPEEEIKDTTPVAEIPKTTDSNNHEADKEVVESTEEDKTSCRKCDDEVTVDPVKPGHPVQGYLKGFAKRAVICTLLVMVAKSAWPEIQSRFWPEAPVKEGKLYILNDKSFRGHVKSGDNFVMFYAPWCGHCKQLKPTWEQLAKKPGVKGVQISKVDCTASEATCKEYNVSGYPTLLYFRNGKMIDTFSGDKSIDGMKSYLKKKKKDKGVKTEPKTGTKSKAKTPKEKPRKDEV